MSGLLYCSFCGKSQHEVRKLIAGPRVFTCDECVELCNDIITGVKESEDRKPTANTLHTPKQINELLDEYVIGQDDAKKVLSVAVYNHYKRLRFEEEKGSDVELGKSNILLIGPTGSGKTLLAETLARILDVPFAITDATTLTEAGYVGEDVESILQKLLKNCDYNVEKAERGIIYVDEIDKIARRSGSSSLTRDVSGEGVQQALLKLIDGTVAEVPPKGGRKHPMQECITLDTKNILFICGGAFAGLDKMVTERSTKGGIGFGAEVTGKKDKKTLGDILKLAGPEDLIKFGLIPEFVGRLPILTTLIELDEEALVRILTEPKNSLVKQYEKLFEIEDASIDFELGALKAVAHKAMDRKTGARGLRAILEDILLDTMYELPSMKEANKVVIHEDVVTDGSRPVLLFEEREEPEKKEKTNLRRV